VGVSDAGLGSAYGFTINCTAEEIGQVGQKLFQAIKECLKLVFLNYLIFFFLLKINPYLNRKILVIEIFKRLRYYINIK